MSKAARYIVWPCVLCLLILGGLPACNPNGASETKATGEEGDTPTTFERGGKTYTQLSEDGTLWRVSTRPDPGTGTPGTSAIFVSDQYSTLMTEGSIDPGCPCCPPRYGAPPCCEPCCGVEMFWHYPDGQHSMVGDTIGTLIEQTTDYDHGAQVVVELICDVDGTPGSDTALNLYLDAVMSGSEGEVIESKMGQELIQVLPQAATGEYSERVLVRREFRVEAGQATVTLLGRKASPEATAGVTIRAMRMNVYNDLR